MSVSGLNSLMAGGAEVSLLRAMRAVSANGASGDVKFAPREVRHPEVRFERREVRHPEVRFEPRQVIHPTPHYQAAPITRESIEAEMAAACVGMKEKTPHGLLPPWKTCGYIVNPAPIEVKKVKINLIRTDTHHKGAMIDFFC